MLGRFDAVGVIALPIAISLLAICVLSMRSKATSLTAVSTIAIAIHQSFFFASASGGRDRFLAASSLIPGP